MAGANKGKEYKERSKRQALFIQHLAETDRVKHSCTFAGIPDTRIVYHWKKDDPAFAEAWAEAQATYRDNIRQEVHKHAFVGVEEPVFQKGECVGYITKYNTRMMELEAKRAEPAFRDNHKDTEDGKGGGLLVVPADITPEEWVKRELAKNAARSKPGE